MFSNWINNVIWHFLWSHIVENRLSKLSLDIVPHNSNWLCWCCCCWLQFCPCLIFEKFMIYYELMKPRTVHTILCMNWKCIQQYSGLLCLFILMNTEHWTLNMHQAYEVSSSISLWISTKTASSVNRSITVNKSPKFRPFPTTTRTNFQFSFTTAAKTLWTIIDFSSGWCSHVQCAFS